MGVEILKFDPSLAKAFADLNYEWIASAYGIEEHDREILDHPESYIVDRGGQVFFAVSDGVAVGTVAMIKIDAASYELAKMAVSLINGGREYRTNLWKLASNSQRQVKRKRSFSNQIPNRPQLLSFIGSTGSKKPN